MNWFKNLKLRTKYLTVLVINIFLIIVVMVLNIKNVNTQSNNALAVYKSNVLATNELNEINQNLLSMSINITFLLYSKEVNEQILNRLNIINELTKNNLQLLYDFRTHINDSQLENLYYDLKLNYNKYEQEKNRIVQLIKSSRYDSANKIYDTLIFDKEILLNDIKQLKDLNIQKTNEIINNNTNIYKNSVDIMIISIIVSFVVSCLLMLILSGYISKELKKVIFFAKELANGNLEQILDISSNDEIGVLAEALNNAVANMLILIEDLRKAEEKAKNSEERLVLALEGTQDGIWDINLNKNIIYMSERCKEILNIDHDGEYLINEDLGKFTHYKEIVEYIKTLINSTGIKTFSREFLLTNGEGDYKYVLVRGQAIYNNSKITRLAGSISDITLRKKAEEEINYLAHYDVLTKLPNRLFLRKKLSELINNNLNDSMKIALFYIDLDNFKLINDSYGHAAGDALLIKVADRFNKIIKKRGSVYRLGGDEFVFLLDNVKDRSEVEGYANNIIKMFDNQIEIENRKLFVTTSIGIVIYPEDGTDEQTLIKNADTAMYRAKQNGKNRYNFFANEMNIEIVEKADMINNMRHSIINDELKIEYQPKINLESGEITGAEALLRWNSREMGSIPPSKFIPLAEETDMIVLFGEYVMKRACMQTKLWHERGNKPISISINLSAKQLQQQNLLNIITSTLIQVGFDPKYMEVEITESAAVQNIEFTIDILNKLKKLGIKISLDDFGKGYSSLNYLLRLPINTVKIDKDFISTLTKCSKEESMVSSLINLAHDINLKVVAEGVETYEQVKLLKSLHCDEAQGYLFSRPLKSDEFELLLKKGNIKV